MHPRPLLLAVLLACVPVSASAQSASPDATELETEARARFQLGQLYYTQARFAEAAAEFEAAYAIHPHPLLLHNIYLARRDLGDVAGATEALRRYLEVATDLSAADRPDFVPRAFLDEDRSSVRCFDVERRQRRRNVEGNRARASEDGEVVRPDLVRRIAVRRDAIGPHDDGLRTSGRPM